MTKTTEMIKEFNKVKLRKKINTILVNQVNNVHRKTLSNDEDSCYWSPIRISVISFYLGQAEFKSKSVVFMIFLLLPDGVQFHGAV